MSQSHLPPLPPITPPTPSASSPLTAELQAQGRRAGIRSTLLSKLGKGSKKATKTSGAE